MVERRKIPRPKKGTTMRRILDITYTQIRKTEAEQCEQYSAKKKTQDDAPTK